MDQIASSGGTFGD